MKNRTVIYDFDGTLFNSPNREIGEAIYQQSTGTKFPFQGWWGRNETLLPPIVPEKPGPEWLIVDPVAAYKKDSKDKNCELILMTGRPFKNKKRVIEICDHFDLKFDQYYFRGQKGQKGHNTIEIKTNFIIDNLIHDRLEILEIWEDRPEHVLEFSNFAKQCKSKYNKHLKQFIIHDFLNKQEIVF